MTENREDPVEQAKEHLLDPFKPVFPIPGMWGFAFGFIFALVSFVGSLILLFSIAALHPAYELLAVAGASLTSAILVIFAARGFKIACNILLLCSLTPLVVLAYTLSLDKPVDGLTLVYLTFSVAAFVLLLSTNTRALVNVLSIRRIKIKQMKKDGTYEENLRNARERWNRKG